MMSRAAIILVLIAIPCLGSSAEEMPLLVGGHAHGARNIQVLADLGVGNFVWIPKRGYPMGNTPWDDANDIMADVDSCVKNNMHFMISQRRGLGPSFKPGGGEYGGDTTPEIYDSATIRKVKDTAGELFTGLLAEELDIDLLQNSLRPGFRSRLPQIYNFTDREGGRKSYELELLRLRNMYHGYGKGVSFMPDTCVTFQHSGFRIGADIVMCEMLESLPNVELQLAYLRGGAQQFGENWGVWISPWYYGKIPTEDQQLWPNAIAQPGEGHASSALKRCLYLAFGSGARVLTMQETEPIFSQKQGGGYQLAAWGKELKSFWDYARNHSEKPQPIVSLALMVNKNSGWAPGHLNGDWIEHESVWGKLPIDRSDNMLSRYLDVLIPGYGREKGWWKEKGRTYPGYFAQTPIGAFDIVSSDIDADRLTKYPWLVLMGDVDMTDDLLKTLRLYVKHGGNLLVNTCQMRLHESFVQDPDFLGATIGESYQWSDWSKSNLLMRRIFTSSKIIVKQKLIGISSDQFDEPWYAAQDVQVKSAEILADDGAGNPVLLRNKYGDGYVYLSTPEYMLEGFDDFYFTLNFFKDLILAASYSSPISITSPDSNRPQEDISWVASYQRESVMVIIANHGRNDRFIDVEWYRPCSDGQVEVGAPLFQSRESGIGRIFRLMVAPEDVSVLRIRLPKD